MSPSHGLFARYSYYYEDPWSTYITLSTKDLYESKSLFIAGFAFDVLTLAALICGVVWACLIRDHKGVLKGVLTSLFAWLLAMVLIIIEESFFLAETVVTNYYLIDVFLYVFFLSLSECMLIFVFYNIIHKLLDRLTDSGRPYAAVVIIHWIVLALAVVLAVASWALYVGYEVTSVQDSFPYRLGRIYTKVESARAILYWIVSLEILAWSIFATVKAGSHRFVSRMPAIALIVGSVFWFALNLMWAVVYMRYALSAVTFSPNYLQTVESVCQFFFCVGIYVGLLLCCMNWSKLGGPDKPADAAQYPYGAVPAGYPTYPAYQAYPHFPQWPQQYPQQYPQQGSQHMQQPQPQQTYQQPQQQPQQQSQQQQSHPQ